MVIIMGMIFYLSHQPGDSAKLPQFVGIDKLAHVIVYGILAGAFLYSLQPFTHDSNYAVAAFVVVLFCILFGISDEFHQSFIPARNVSFWDVVADGLGALLVACLWYKKTAGRK
jgi:VanZ family protein